MKVKIRTNQLIHILDIEGDIFLADANQLKELVMKMIEKKAECFIINLAKITSIDSSGIGAIIYIHSTLKKLGMKLAIVNITEPVQQIIEKTKLASFLPICKDVNEAIDKLSPKI